MSLPVTTIISEATTTKSTSRRLDYDVRYRVRHPERIRQQKQSYYWRHRDQVLDRHRNRRKSEYSRVLEQERKSYLKIKYGLTLDDYRQLHRAQGGCCAICGRPEALIPQVRGAPRLQVDHNHATDHVRGLLCVGCNRLVGRVEAVGTRRILEYLG